VSGEKHTLNYLRKRRETQTSRNSRLTLYSAMVRLNFARLLVSFRVSPILLKAILVKWLLLCSGRFNIRTRDGEYDPALRDYFKKAQ